MLLILLVYIILLPFSFSPFFFCYQTERSPSKSNHKHHQTFSIPFSSLIILFTSPYIFSYCRTVLSPPKPSHKHHQTFPNLFFFFTILFVAKQSRNQNLFLLSDFLLYLVDHLVYFVGICFFLWEIELIFYEFPICIWYIKVIAIIFLTFLSFFYFLAINLLGIGI